MNSHLVRLLDPQPKRCRVVVRRAVTAALAGALVACGGGGGGGSLPNGGGGPPPSSGFQLSFQPGTLSVSYYQGEPPLVSVEVRASQAYAAPVQVAVIDTTGVLSGEVSVTAASSLLYTASLRLSGTLAAGKYSGSIEVRVCEDTPLTCAKPVPGSPWKLPYQFTVRPQTDLRPLSAVPGVSAWTSHLGGGDRNAARAVTAMADVMDRRWTAPALAASIGEGMAVVQDGLVVTMVRPQLGSQAVLVARHEHDGSIAWKRPLGSLNDEMDSAPTVLNGQVYVFAADHDRSIVWRINLATGAVLGERTFARYSGVQRGAMGLGGKLYSCRSLLASGYGLVRFDATTLEAEAADGQTDYLAGCSPATDGTRIYMFANRNLVAVDPGNKLPAYRVAVDVDSNLYDGLTVLDGAGRGYVAVFAGLSAWDGKSSLFAFDTATGKVLWHLRGSFTSAPVISNGTLYTLNDTAVEARSTSDGSLLWSVKISGNRINDVDANLVATTSHVFVATPWTTEAIDLQSRSIVWTDTVGGPLAISQQGVLFIRPSFSGGIRAINLK